MDETLAELKSRLGAGVRPPVARGVLEWDQKVMMPPGRRAVRAERLATLERVAHERFIDERDRRARSRSCARLESSLPLRLRRREPDPRHPPRLGEGDASPADAAGRDDEGRRRRAWRPGSSARAANDYARLPALARPPSRAQQRVRRVLRAGRRAVRHAPRRLRAGDDDRRGAGGVRPPQGGARAA